jgi:hypothetical protein
MQCKEQSRWQAMIIDRLANELGEEDAVLLEQHLSDCESCMREARTLAGVLTKASGPMEWTADPVLEERLLAALGPRPAEAHRGGLAASADRPSLLAALAGIRLRPSFSVGTAIALVLIAAAAGFWTGRVRPGSPVPRASGVVQDWIEAPADANRMPAPESGSGGPATDLLVSSPSFARASPDEPGEAAGVNFVPAQSDAIVLPDQMLADSL